MNDTMNYKAYATRVEFDNRDDIFVGRLLGITDVVSFHADNVVDFRKAFEEAVDCYLATCKEIGQLPNKPVNGKILLRVQPSIHAAALNAARLAGKSLNQWASEAIQHAAEI
jgi:predicted HicB family RNase H-like nuclease